MTPRTPSFLAGAALAGVVLLAPGAAPNQPLPEELQRIRDIDHGLFKRGSTLRGGRSGTIEDALERITQRLDTLDKSVAAIPRAGATDPDQLRRALRDELADSFEKLDRRLDEIDRGTRAGSAADEIRRAVNDLNRRLGAGGRTIDDVLRKLDDIERRLGDIERKVR